MIIKRMHMGAGWYDPLYPGFWLRCYNEATLTVNLNQITHPLNSDLCSPKQWH